MKKLFCFWVITIFYGINAQITHKIVEYDFSTDLPQFTTMPLGIEMELAGNFAELRKNHFHGGIDIKTNQKEGYNVYAVGEGFISRINVKGSGYGHALYIDHPNGYTTVYGHLKEFSPKIQKYIEAKQYELKQSEIEYYPHMEELPIAEGEIIALSGNTGGSSGPHLHFEVRETDTERPMNPFLFGFEVKDHSKPIIAKLYGIPVQGKIKGSTELSYIEAGKTYVAEGKVAFGVKAYDKHDNAPNNNGIYGIKCFVDDSLYYSYKAYRFSFDHNRYIYSLTRYPAYAKYRSWVYQTFREAENELEMFDYLRDDGVVEVKEGKRYEIRIEVSDFKGNKSSQKFYISGKAGSYENEAFNVKAGSLVHLSHQDYSIEFPRYTFSKNQQIDLKTENGKLIVGSSDIPVMHYFNIGKKVETADTLHYYFKSYSNYGRSESFEYPARYKEGYFWAEVRNLGTFELKKDEGKPIIKGLNIRNGGGYPKTFKARFKIDDNETDIKKYDCYIDGNWVIGIYDKKYKSVSLDFNQDIISKGTHSLKITVEDDCKNRNQYNAQITIY